MTLGAFLLFIFTSNLLTFGNGRVMVPLLQRRLVDDSGALTLDQFLFAFTVGRITPGPANLYVAALGYMLYGWVGAILTAVVVILPAFLMLPLQAAYKRLESSAAVRGFSRGLTAASVGLIAATTIQLGRETLTTPAALMVCALTLVMLQALKWNALLCLGIASGVGIATALYAPALALP